MESHRFVARLSAVALAVGAALAFTPASASAGPAPVAKAQKVAATTHTLSLKTGLADGRMVYLDDKGAVNPSIDARVGDTIELTIASGEGAQHDFVVSELGVASKKFDSATGATRLTFKLTKAGSFKYFCSIAGHRQIGMEGEIVVAGNAPLASVVAAADARPAVAAPAPVAPAVAGAVSVAMDPSAVPAPIGTRAAKTVDYRVESVELVGRLADGTTFEYWTFDRKVPGTMLRVRQGDTVNLTFANAATSRQVHSIDLHAVTGPGGGAEFLQVKPGDEKRVTFKALNPGVYVYHCATPSVPHHISAGMYGLIVVEPEGGLPKVDREYYVMQGDIYTKHATGAKGHQDFDHAKLAAEQPDYFVFNGAVGALTKEFKLTARVGETVRIFFGVGGPNKVSSFHVIGEIFDRVYAEGSLSSVNRNVQTTLVAPGGATMVEFKVDYPGKYMLVDHALSRVGKGLAGLLEVTGPADDGVYKVHDGKAGHAEH
jgi:nitrite reductase (NO-forming)